jgi:hypothetical protein
MKPKAINHMRTFNIFFLSFLYIVTRIMHPCPLHPYFSCQFGAVCILFLFVSLANALFSSYSSLLKVFFVREETERNRPVVIRWQRTFCRRKRKDDDTNITSAIIKRPASERNGKRRQNKK